MRIFCPAMVVGRPSLPTARCACPGRTRAGSPRREPAGPRRCGLTRWLASGPRGRVCRGVKTYDTLSRGLVPGSPAPEGAPAVRGADVDPAHAEVVKPHPRAPESDVQPVKDATPRCGIPNRGITEDPETAGGGADARCPCLCTLVLTC